MKNSRIVRLAALSAALVFTACGGGTKKCTSNADCATGQICNTGTGQCTTSNLGGGTGGGVTGGGSGGGNMGGGTGGGSTGGGTGGGNMGGGTGGGSTGGGGGAIDPDGGVLAGGETCDMAVALASTVTLTGTTTGLMSDYDLARSASGSGCNGYSRHPGADTVYQLSVPARSTVSVSVQGVGGDGTAMTAPIYDPAIYLVATPPSNCATATADGGVQATCIASSDDPFNDASDLLLPETVKWTNFDAANASDVFLVIESGWDPTASQEDTDGDGTPDTWVIGQGDYSVTVTTTALPAAPANDTCATAEMLTGMPMNGTTKGAAPDISFDPNGNCVNTAGLGDAFYSVVLPPGKRLNIEATTQQADTIIGFNIFEGACSAVASCVGDVSQTAGTAATAYYDNRGAADITVMVEVATSDMDNLGADFSITGTVTDIPPPPGNDACTAPTALMTNASTMGTFSGATDGMLFGGMAPATCAEGSNGDMKDVYYTLLVHNGERANVTVTAMGALDPVLNVMDSPATCSGVTACVASADSTGAGAVESLRYDNTTGADVTLLIQVGSYDGAEDTFEIQATVAAIPPPPANDACAGAVMLMPGTQVNGSTQGAAGDSPYAASPAMCRAVSATTPRKDVYYSLDVGAGQMATVVVTPVGMQLDLFVNAFDSTLTCSGVAMCVAGVDGTGRGAAETLTYKNMGTAAQTLIIQVGDYYGDEADFTVLATVQ